jgi:hypothetical protein
MSILGAICIFLALRSVGHRVSRCGAESCKLNLLVQLIQGPL